MRWLYHVRPRAEAGPITPGPEGFVHASYQPLATESARLYFPAGADLVVHRIDPRRVDVRVEIAETPRGPMPHVYGVIPADAVRSTLLVTELAAAPDHVHGTRFAFVAFEGMTLLDLVGVLDPVSRIASMGFDPETTCDVVAATPSTTVWRGAGASVVVASTRVRPSLEAYDVVVVAGGSPARALVDDPEVVSWLAAFPANRPMASVCTGALLLGAAGRLRGRRATTHRTALDRLAAFDAVAVAGERVVEAWPTVTAGGVTCGIDLGLWLVRRFAGDDAASRVARQMDVPLTSA